MKVSVYAADPAPASLQQAQGQRHRRPALMQAASRPTGALLV
tara:strand:- start:1743 stop:1868 length:126 start_codon:yes stop_codon:yes gene_type:complete